MSFTTKPASPGSSPHTRGALGPEGHGLSGVGIIPAYAGSTSERRRTMPFGRDHPRIRGEHSNRPVKAPLAPGSSPHTRGAQRRVLDCEKRHRIIPAYAGSTFGHPRYDGGPRDHPRIRGEHRLELTRWHDAVGSSPHTRGAPCEQPRIPQNSRIIPAYAGSTPPRGERTRRKSDHPRIRGEHLQSRMRASGQPGSSPHTRGAPPRLEHGLGDRGIIPAYAGSTVGARHRLPHAGDHPRIRGEHPRST